MANVDITALSAGLKERREHYSTIFGLALDNGFQIEGFTVWPVDQKYEIKRKVLGNLTQPGKKNRHGGADFIPASNFMTILSRTGELAPVKIDLTLGEDEITDLNNSFMQELGSSDPMNIHSVAGYDFIMDNVFAKAGHELDAAIYAAELGYNYNVNTLSTAFQGGLNLMDGLGVKFTDAIADSSIAAGQVITKVVGGFTAGNILAELAKIIDKVDANADTRREMSSAAFRDVEYGIFLDPAVEGLVIDALDALAYKSIKTVERQADGIIIPRKLKRTKLMFPSWMTGQTEAFFSPLDNLFMLPKKGAAGADARSSASFKVEEAGRNVNMYIDFDFDVNFADPRPLVIYK